MAIRKRPGRNTQHAPTPRAKPPRHPPTPKGSGARDVRKGGSH